MRQDFCLMGTWLPAFLILSSTTFYLPCRSSNPGAAKVSIPQARQSVVLWPENYAQGNVKKGRAQRMGMGWIAGLRKVEHGISVGGFWFEAGWFAQHDLLAWLLLIYRNILDSGRGCPDSGFGWIRIYVCPPPVIICHMASELPSKGKKDSLFLCRALLFEGDPTTFNGGNLSVTEIDCEGHFADLPAAWVHILKWEGRAWPRRLISLNSPPPSLSLSISLSFSSSFLNSHSSESLLTEKLV